VFGHAGAKVIVFPTREGRFYEYENLRMTEVLRDKLEKGFLQLFCVDGIDSESFYCRWAHPSGRIQRQAIRRIHPQRGSSIHGSQESASMCHRAWMQPRRLPCREHCHASSASVSQAGRLLRTLRPDNKRRGIPRTFSKAITTKTSISTRRPIFCRISRAPNGSCICGGYGRESEGLSALCAPFDVHG
jgi:hypothetical protein